MCGCYDCIFCLSRNPEVVVVRTKLRVGAWWVSSCLCGLRVVLDFFGGLRFWGLIDEVVSNLGLLVILRVIVVVFPSFFGGFITSRKSRENIGCDGRRIDAVRCFTNI